VTSLLTILNIWLSLASDCSGARHSYPAVFWTRFPLDGQELNSSRLDIKNKMAGLDWKRWAISV
jgi:hypothetical protein